MKKNKTKNDEDIFQKNKKYFNCVESSSFNAHFNFYII